MTSSSRIYLYVVLRTHPCPAQARQKLKLTVASQRGDCVFLETSLTHGLGVAHGGRRVRKRLGPGMVTVSKMAGRRALGSLRAVCWGHGRLQSGTGGCLERGSGA